MKVWHWSNAPAILLLLVGILLRSDQVEGKNRYHERNMEATTGGTQRAQDGQQQTLRRMAVVQNERGLHYRRGRSKSGGGGVVGGNGRGGGRGRGMRRGGRGGRFRYIIDDDFFYEDDDWYTNTPPRRARRSRFRAGPDDDGVGQGGGGAVILVRPANGPPYRGTGIGRLDRGRGRDLPRPGRPRGNRFPPGYRASTIRPTTSPPVGPTAAPTTAAPGATSPGPTTAATAAGPTVAPGSTAAPSAAPTNDILIRSTFALTYFTGDPADVDRDLTAEEYAELATLMDEFYTAEFMADPAFSTDFRNYATTITSMMYTMGGDPHIMMDFDANFMFANGSTITPNQVLTKMEGLQYETFITNYLMRNPPLNQLDNVQRVQFTAATAPA